MERIRLVSCLSLSENAERCFFNPQAIFGFNNRQYRSKSDRMMSALMYRKELMNVTKKGKVCMHTEEKKGIYPFNFMIRLRRQIRDFTFASSSKLSTKDIVQPGECNEGGQGIYSHKREEGDV